MKAPKTTELPDFDAIERELFHRWDLLLLAARRTDPESRAHRLLVDAIVETGRELAAVRKLRKVLPALCRAA